MKYTELQTNIILNEIKSVLDKIDNEEIVHFIQDILKARKIVCCGAGRVGLSTKAFAMRLAHLGFNVSFLGDSNVLSIGKGDLLIVSSGSGETKTIVDVAQIAKRNMVRIDLLTNNPKSKIGLIADTIVRIDAPSKTANPKNNVLFKSIQPMTTLNEQCLYILFDSVVLKIMEKTKQSNLDLLKRHSILE